MEYLELLFGEGISLAQLLVWFTLGVFGVFASMVFDVYSSGISWSDFSLKRWWSDNAWRTLLSIFVIILAMAFGEEIVGIPTGNWSMFLAGFTSDKLIENLVQRRRKKKELKS